MVAGYGSRMVAGHVVCEYAVGLLTNVYFPSSSEEWRCPQPVESLRIVIVMIRACSL